ncbi:MAG: hypothetical protein ABIP34_14560 [Rhodoferax sp.]|uniref:hypothetical protein n=1 Tax=Rhodoferax sp. TaxID=50421 RepID=UPI0032660649
MTARPTPHGLEASLLRVEQLLDEVSAALIAGEPLVLEAASTALRQAMADMAVWGRTPAGLQSLDAGMRHRLEKVSLTLSQQRANLARRAVVVDRALATVLPQAQPASTYSGGKAATYRGGAARIYAAAAN